MLVRMLSAVALIAIPLGAAQAQYYGGYDTRTANSTPRMIPQRQSTLAERAARSAAEARAWRESARYAGRAGLRNTGRVLRGTGRFLGRKSLGAAGEFFGNPKRACAPTRDYTCR
jgi:hypothetical protein